MREEQTCSFFHSITVNNWIQYTFAKNVLFCKPKNYTFNSPLSIRHFSFYLKKQIFSIKFVLLICHRMLHTHIIHLLKHLKINGRKVLFSIQRERSCSSMAQGFILVDHHCSLKMRFKQQPFLSPTPRVCNGIMSPRGELMCHQRTAAAF